MVKWLKAHQDAVQKRREKRRERRQARHAKDDDRRKKRLDRRQKRKDRRLKRKDGRKRRLLRGGPKPKCETWAMGIKVSAEMTCAHGVKHCLTSVQNAGTSAAKSTSSCDNLGLCSGLNRGYYPEVANNQCVQLPAKFSGGVPMSIYCTASTPPQGQLPQGVACQDLSINAAKLGPQTAALPAPAVQVTPASKSGVAPVSGSPLLLVAITISTLLLSHW